MKKRILGVILTMVLSCMPIIANATGDNIEMTTAKITKFETGNMYIFDVEAAVTYENCYVYAAVYGENNALLTVNRVPLQMTGSTAISVVKSENDVLAKVFVWSGEMQPVINVEKIPLISTSTATPTATPTASPTASPTPSPTAEPTPSPTAEPTADPTVSPTPTSDPIVASGTCGNNAVWSLDTDGTLTISGTGNMTNYSRAADVPWYDNREDIKNVVIENGILTIGDYAFSGCKSLMSITIPDSVWVIRQNAFMNCSNLTDIEIPSKVAVIGKAAFANCKAITSITIPNRIASIADMTFLGCSGVESITIPDGVTSIGQYSFMSCKGLTSIIIPDKVTTIDKGAFSNCNSLQTVYYKGSEEQWGEIAVGESNDKLTNAEIVYNYTAE